VFFISRVLLGRTVVFGLCTKKPIKPIKPKNLKKPKNPKTFFKKPRIFPALVHWPLIRWLLHLVQRGGD